MFTLPRVDYRPLQLLQQNIQDEVQSDFQNKMMVEQLRQENDKRIAGQKIVSDAGKAINDYNTEMDQLGPTEALSLFPEKQAAVDRLNQRLNTTLSSLATTASEIDPNIANFIARARDTQMRKVTAPTVPQLAAWSGVPGPIGERSRAAVGTLTDIEAGKQEAIAKRMKDVAEATQKPFHDSTPFDAINPKTKKVEKAVYRTNTKTGEGQIVFPGAETPGTTTFDIDPKLQGTGALDAIAKMDPGVAKNVDMIAHYKAQAKTLYPSRNYRGVGGYTLQQIMPLVQQVNPSYDEKNFPTAQRAEIYWTSGQGKTRVGQLNTVAGHITDLDKAVDALDSGDIKALNAIAQSVGVQTGQSAPLVFDAIKQAVAGELSGLFKAGAGGASPTTPEMQEAGATLSRTTAPQAIKDVIRADVGLIKSRMETEAQAYHTGTAKDDFFERFLTPKAKGFYAEYFGYVPTWKNVQEVTQSPESGQQTQTSGKKSLEEIFGR